MFARELQRRSDAQGWGITSIASHPGLSRTNLLPSQGRSTPLWRFFQTAERGAVPTLYAATAQDAQGGRYYGPTGLLEARGALGHARVPDAAQADEGLRADARLVRDAIHALPEDQKHAVALVLVEAEHVQVVEQSVER